MATKVYQDFVPPTELVEEPQCDTLLVYLPGKLILHMLLFTSSKFAFALVELQSLQLKSATWFLYY